MNPALLLLLILGLFLLRVPMAFAILGPCLLYLIGEGYSMGLAFRLAMAGIDSWPLLAVPLFILVGIIATQTEIADPTVRRRRAAPRPPPGRSGLRECRCQPGLLA